MAPPSLRPLLPLVALALPCLEASGHEAQRWEMPHHSWDRTTYHTLLNDWNASAGSMPFGDRMLLLPPAADRHGFFACNKAVETRDFEVSFSLFGKSGDLKDGAVAFWLQTTSLAEAYSEKAILGEHHHDWNTGLSNIGLSKLGNKRKFKGLAVMLMSHAGRPVIASLWNSGVREVNLDQFLQADGVQRRDIDWLSSGVQIKVRVSADGSVVGHAQVVDYAKHLPGSVWSFAEDGIYANYKLHLLHGGALTMTDLLTATPSKSGTWRLDHGKLHIDVDALHTVLRLEGGSRATEDDAKDGPGVRAQAFFEEQDKDFQPTWLELFTLPAQTVPDVPKYVGFTGYSGTQGSPLQADLNTIVMTNFNKHNFGEDVSDLIPDDTEEWQKAVEQQFHMATDASQKEAIEKLHKLLLGVVARTTSFDKAVSNRLVKLQDRFSKLDVDIAQFTAATEAFDTNSGTMSKDAVKHHLNEVHSLLSKSKAIINQNKAVNGKHLSQIHQASLDLKEKHGGPHFSAESKAKVTAVADKAKAVEDFASKGSFQATGFLLSMVAVFSCLGCLFFNRMRYYEKKHFF